MADNLKPCPFCGGEAQFRIFDTICNVECPECFNGTRYYALDDYEQAVAAWNARAERTCEKLPPDNGMTCIVRHDATGETIEVGYWKCGVCECNNFEGARYCMKCGARVVA